jgi:hypothetical protein
MTDTPDDKDKKVEKPKTKRPSKGKRTYIRRMKKAARDEGKVYKPEIV